MTYTSAKRDWNSRKKCVTKRYSSEKIFLFIHEVLREKFGNLIDYKKAVDENFQKRKSS